jgi:hypothetical protein
MFYLRGRLIVITVMVVISCAVSLKAQDPEQFTEEQMRDFLLNAKVVKSMQVSQGVTGIYRLTLSDGKITHDAAFQPINEVKQKMTFSNGKTEMNFRDSYKYDIAAFELGKLLGLGDMMPVTIERRWSGMTGALSWWLPFKLDEEKRIKQGIKAPDPEAYAKQMHKTWVFSQLVYDTDRNMGNTLFSENWHVWMIDFTRAFRIYHELEDPKILTRCQRQLLEKLRRLDAAELEQNTKKWLTKPERDAVMARRDNIVSLFEDLIAKKGEGAVLYD